MNTTQKREVPHEFWEALLQVCNYLMRDYTFIDSIYGPTAHRADLRRSFDIVDNWLKEYLEEHGF
ncbi:MAG: hypothetical protein SH850_02880 [Planctomycetaceae bacterium]|nr:hypothetical protein [Planctomycetaceae bacterium]